MLLQPHFIPVGHIQNIHQNFCCMIPFSLFNFNLFELMFSSFVHGLSMVHIFGPFQKVHNGSSSCKKSISASILFSFFENLHILNIWEFGSEKGNTNQNHARRTIYNIHTLPSPMDMTIWCAMKSRICKSPVRFSRISITFGKTSPVFV